MRAVALGELTQAVLESLPWWGSHRRTAQVAMNSAGSQAQKWGFELAHSNICPIYDHLLEVVKRPVL